MKLSWTDVSFCHSELDSESSEWMRICRCWINRCWIKFSMTGCWHPCSAWRLAINAFCMAVGHNCVLRDGLRQLRSAWRLATNALIVTVCWHPCSAWRMHITVFSMTVAFALCYSYFFCHFEFFFDRRKEPVVEFAPVFVFSICFDDHFSFISSWT